MNYTELLSIISKQWATVYDIKKIGACGRDNATKIRNKISLEINKKGYDLPICKTKVVPMNYVIEYFKLDIDYIFSMAEKEKKLCKGV